MPCGISGAINSFGSVLGLMSCQCGYEHRQVLVGFQSNGSPWLHPACQQPSSATPSLALVQASDRRRCIGSLRRITVSIPSSPSRMLAATLGRLLVEPAGEIAQEPLGLVGIIELPSPSPRSATDACSDFGSRSVTLRALWIWHRWIGVWAPKVRRITLLRAVAPSTMNSRQTFGSSPRSIRLSCTTAAFLVAPSTKASGSLRSSASIPSVARRWTAAAVQSTFCGRPRSPTAR
jgi:hypothetical protein